MDNLCAYCENCIFQPKNNKPTTLEDCVYNVIIFENEEKILLYNLPSKSIFKITRNSGLKEIEFQEAIREIDIIPTKAPEWKRFQILNLAKDLGFFGINA